MEPITIGIIGIVAVVALLLLRVPVAIAMATVGFLGYWAISGISPTLKLIGMIPFTTVSNYTFTVIPLFILMGFFVYYGNLATGLFGAINKWFSFIRGGVLSLIHI